MKASQRHAWLWIAGVVTAALLSSCALPVSTTPPSAPTPTSAPVPFLAIAPERAAVGETIAVIGSDWQPGEAISIGLLPTSPTQPGSILLAVINADPQGRFRTEVRIPIGTTTGQWKLYAQAQALERFALTNLEVLSGEAAPSATPQSEPTSTATRAPSTRPTRTPTPPRPTRTPAPPTLSPTPASFPDWKGEYFPNPTLSGPPLVIRNDPTLDFNWADGSPDLRIPTDNFSARWTRNLLFNAGTYRFVFFVDDGVRLFIDDVLVLDEWRDGPPREVFRDVTLSARLYRFRVEYYERSGFAVLRFNVFLLPPNTPTPLPTTTRTPTPTPTHTPTPPRPTRTPTVTPIPLATNTPTVTPIPLPTNTPTVTPIPLPTNTPTPTPSPTPSPTPTPTDTPTATPVPTDTPTPAPSPTPSPTPTPTDTPTATPVSLPTDTPTPTPPSTPSPTPTPTDTPTPTGTPLPPTATATPTPPGPTASLTATVIYTPSTQTLLVSSRGWGRREFVLIAISTSETGRPAVRVGGARANIAGVVTATLTLELAAEEPGYAVLYNRTNSRRIVVPIQVLETTEGSSGLRLQPTAAARRHGEVTRARGTT